MIFPCLLANLGPDKELQVFVYSGDKLVGSSLELPVV